jgi:hypothetical protein
MLLPSRKPSPKENILVRLIIAVVVGLAIAIGGTVLVVNVVSGHSDKPATSSQYNYGSR